MSEDQPPRVLAVCTGNICRSPLMERMLAAGLPGVTVRSAGTHAMVGDDMDPASAAALTARGLDPGGFRARDLTAEQVAGAALVVVASRAHRAAVVRLEPRAAGRTFTLLELARLTEGLPPLTAADPAERLTELARLAAARRGTVRAARAEDDDLPDPYRRPAERFEECARTVEAALAGPLALLRPREDERPHA